MKLTFAADEVDENGFIVDFGELHYIKDWIDENLDHSCAFSASDPHRSKLEELEEMKLVRPLFIENASCEGLAKHLFEIFNPMVSENTGGRARIVSIDLLEDSKNSAYYSP
jgi:6-pyruvoyltetrahydropterin/6-carboxytetrahydropterin synthase